MTISLFAKTFGVARLPRLGAILALTAFLSIGASARDAHAALVVTSYADFAFKFEAVLTAPILGSVTLTGSGILNAERTGVNPAQPWLVDNVTDGLLHVGAVTGGSGLNFTLSYATPNTFPSPIGNDNLLFPWASPPNQLDLQGITFLVEEGTTTVGYLNITDPPSFNTFSAESVIEGGGSASGAGVFQVAPGPTPGTGVAAFAFLLLAGAAARARGLLAG
jgi:hypothetical protein